MSSFQDVIKESALSISHFFLEKARSLSVPDLLGKKEYCCITDLVGMAHTALVYYDQVACYQQWQMQSCCRHST